MSHYKTNLRDIEFNLFEVLGRDEVLGTGPFGEIDGESAREILREVERLSREDLAVVVRGQRPQPARLRPRPRTPHRSAASFKASYQAWMDAEFWRLQVFEEHGRHPRPVVARLGDRRDGARRQRPDLDVRRRAGVRQRRPPQRQRPRQAGRPVHGRPPVGLHDGPHRARRRLRRRRRPRQGRRQRRRLLEHHGRQALHHQRDARHEREHHAPRPRAPRGRRGRGRPGHEGPLALLDARAALRPRDRRADRRAQRRLRHQRRAQDGHQGLQHLRGHLRRPAGRRRRAGQGLAARRGPRRHRADVPGHRERPDDGRHQGHRHAVDRLPQRARLRQGARPGRRPDPGRRQDRAARDDHPPPRRTPLADDAEVVRRGDARAGALHRDLAGPGHDRRARRAPRTPTRPASPRRSTTCCSRS